MKLFGKLAVLVGLVGTSSFALAEGPVPAANMFTCEGGGVVVSYSTTSYLGTPNFRLTVNDVNVVPGAAEQNFVSLKTDQVPYGLLVSALVSSKVVQDKPTDVYSFVIPFVSASALEHAGNKVEFKSVLIEGSLDGFTPEWVVRQRLDKTTELTCVASKAIF